MLLTVILYEVPFGDFNTTPAPAPPTYNAVVLVLPILAVLDPSPIAV